MEKAPGRQFLGPLLGHTSFVAIFCSGNVSFSALRQAEARPQGSIFSELVLDVMLSRGQICETPRSISAFRLDVISYASALGRFEDGSQWWMSAALLTSMLQDLLKLAPFHRSPMLALRMVPLCFSVFAVFTVFAVLRFSQFCGFAVSRFSRVRGFHSMLNDLVF